MTTDFETVSDHALAGIAGGKEITTKFGLTKSGRDHWCTFQQFAEIHPKVCSGFPGGDPGPKIKF